MIPTPTPSDLQKARARLGLTRAAFAARLNVHVRTLDGWEYHGVRPPTCLALALKHVLEEAESLKNMPASYYAPGEVTDG